MAADFRTSRWGPRLALVGVASWLAYEWGPGNETVSSWVLANVLERYTGLDGVVLAVVIGFAITAVQQTASGLTALLGFSMLERTAAASWASLERSQSGLRGGWAAMGWPTRTAVVFGLGTTAVALMEITTSGQVGVRRHARVVITSAVLSGAVIAVVAGVASVVVAVGRAIEPLRPGTERLLGVLSQPWPWLALAALLVVRQVYVGRRAAATDESPAGS